MPSSSGALTERAFVAHTGSTAHVAAASTVLFDLFNASTTQTVRVMSIVHSVLVGVAVTGVGMTFALVRTTSVGTGGTGLTLLMLDTDDTVPSTSVTARLKPTGGAAQGVALVQWNRNTEETVAPVNAGVCEMLPEYWRRAGIVLRANQGIAILQQTNSSVGASSFSVSGYVE